MDAIESVATDMGPEPARRPRRFPRLAILGVGLISGGVAVSFMALGVAWAGRAPFWFLPTFIWGLTTMAAGAGVIVWRGVVRFRRHGPLVAVLAGVGCVGLAFLIAVAAFIGTSLITQVVTSLVATP
jgi:hypothetical protein